jgi:hypothetical protein
MCIRHAGGTYVTRCFPHGEAYVLALYNAEGDVSEFHDRYLAATGGTGQLLRIVYWDAGYFNVETPRVDAEIPVEIVLQMIQEARTALR